MEKATLVLEGGATRGVFTSGVLDYLMEKELYTSHVIGVSAGSCNGVDYISRQIGRTKECMIYDDDEFDYYFGVRKVVKEKSVLNMDLIFDKFPNEIYPFDYDTYFQSDIKAEWVVTNCETGKPEYKDHREDREADAHLPCILQYAAFVSDREDRWSPVFGWRTRGFDSVETSYHIWQ